jgi:hypothetical protein
MMKVAAPTEQQRAKALTSNSAIASLPPLHGSHQPHHKKTGRKPQTTFARASRRSFEGAA